MRLHPPVWFENRNVKEDIEVGGAILPKGSIVALSRYSHHRNGNFWKSPDAFIPERFDPDDKENYVSTKSTAIYIPFSRGPRACIGRHFAMLEMLVILATLLSRFRIHATEVKNDSFTARLTIEPKNHLPVRFELRACSLFLPMKQFPYITDYMNETFRKEKQRFDYIFIRPILLILYFFLRCFAFPFKFLFHRKPWGWEGYCIDGVLAFGLKRFASYDAVELLIRHVQIEPILYRYLLTGHDFEDNEKIETSLNGIFGNFGLNSLEQIIRNNMTIGHDELSYELGEKFDRETLI